MRLSRTWLVPLGILSSVCLLAACGDEQEMQKPELPPLTLSDLQKNWCTAYEGWDSLMNVRTAIQKRLVLNADSTYTNVLGGIVFLPNVPSVPQLFEIEAGKYEVEIADSLCIFTFHCLSDSLVDFGAGQLVGYSAKHLHHLDGTESDVEKYIQTVTVRPGENGSYRLHAADSTIFSLDGKGQPVPYDMDIEKKEP